MQLRMYTLNMLLRKLYLLNEYRSILKKISQVLKGLNLWKCKSFFE